MYGGRGYSALIVDVNITKNKREYLVECETRPNIKRLVEKGKRRNSIRCRTVYILVVPMKWYQKLDWHLLKGYFDIVIAYNIEDDVFNGAIDLRFLGSLRDMFLNALVPVYKSDEAKSVIRWIKMKKNLLVYNIKGQIHCIACKHGIPTPWRFCPRDDCLDSQYGYY